MKKVIIDIETAGRDFDSLDDISKEYMLKYANSIEERDEVMDSLSFYPTTAQVVAIGMIEADSDKSFVLFQNSTNSAAPHKEKDTTFIPAKSEKELLSSFWSMLKEYRQIVTFNGRGFDCPFLMIRSAINEIKPSKNLMPNRYSSDTHIDLLDRLTFYGSVRKKFSLHMWCKAFGINSPKEGEVVGHQVKDLFKEGKFLEIARYCVGDIVATKRLFDYWDKYLNS
ncbi:ribonuclease H-like domain-containing protein [Thermoproteota archaeon]